MGGIVRGEAAGGVDDTVAGKDGIVFILECLGYSFTVRMMRPTKRE